MIRHIFAKDPQRSEDVVSGSKMECSNSNDHREWSDGVSYNLPIMLSNHYNSPQRREWGLGKIRYFAVCWSLLYLFNSPSWTLGNLSFIPIVRETSGHVR